MESKNNNKIISVIMPVYNSKRTIDRCISSVINQTYKNIEVIIIDDGSTDGSAEICDRWANRDPRIKVYHKNNEGPGKARNMGINIARTDGYITFIDSDDWIEPFMYENLMKKAVLNNCDITGCPSVIEYPNGKRKLNHHDVKEGYINKYTCIIDFLEGNRHAWGSVHNKLYSKKIWNNIRFPETSHLEDYVVSTKLFNEANQVWFCATPYYHYIYSISSLSRSGWNDETISMIDTTDMITEYIHKNCKEESVYNATYKFKFRTDVDILYSMFKGRPIINNGAIAKIKSRSKKDFIGYILHSKKQFKDIKMILKYIIYSNTI